MRARNLHSVQFIFVHFVNVSSLVVTKHEIPTAGQFACQMMSEHTEWLLAGD